MKSSTWNILLVSASISSRKEGEKCAYSASRGSLNIYCSILGVFLKVNFVWNYLALTVCWRCGIPPSRIGPPPGRVGGGGEGMRLKGFCMGLRMCQVALHCSSWSSSSFNILSLQQEKILPQLTWINAILESGFFVSIHRKCWLELKMSL